MADVKVEAEQPAGIPNEEAATNVRRPWTAPMVIASTRETRKTVDSYGEGKLFTTTLIS